MKGAPCGGRAPRTPSCNLIEEDPGKAAINLAVIVYQPVLPKGLDAVEGESGNDPMVGHGILPGRVDTRGIPGDAVGGIVDDLTGVALKSDTCRYGGQNVAVVDQGVARMIGAFYCIIAGAHDRRAGGDRPGLIVECV